MTAALNPRQTQIAEAATALFLDQGVGVSTAAIAKAAGVSNGTLFNAFPTKQHLIDAIYLTTKRDFFDALALKDGEGFTRASVRRLWEAHLTWSRSAPNRHKIKRLLLEAGLASAEAQSQADEMGLAHAAWMSDAHAAGIIRGPNIAFIGELIFFHIDLVIDQSLTGANEAMAFDMLCNAIGLE
ncbi:MAG: TetR/AcrR family transcriptional regulator [Pseudomonadota bacterium]